MINQKNLKIEANNNIFLPKTFLPKTRLAFIFHSGGLGDYINYMSAVIWALEENPQVTVYLFARQPFLDVANYILSKYSNAYVYHHDKLKDLPDHTLVVYPKDQLINPTGAHLMDLGFMYYAQMDKPPAGYGYLPELSFDMDTWKWPELLDRPYAVFTPGSTARARVMYGRYFNELVSYSILKGITPVFLGKRDFAHQVPDGVGYNATFQNDYDLTKGIDLTEKTTLLEATQIMSKACYVIGLDNGLLHFAGTTSAPIIFGHNVATVEHREIRRRNGFTLNIKLEESVLSCIGCQSRMRYVQHKFSKCIYEKESKSAYKCLDMLFADGCSTWKRAIDHILNLKTIKNRISSYSMKEID